MTNKINPEEHNNEQPFFIKLLGFLFLRTFCCNVGKRSTCLVSDIGHLYDSNTCTDLRNPWHGRLPPSLPKLPPAVLGWHPNPHPLHVFLAATDASSRAVPSFWRVPHSWKLRHVTIFMTASFTQH